MRDEESGEEENGQEEIAGINSGHFAAGAVTRRFYFPLRKVRPLTIRQPSLETYQNDL